MKKNTLILVAALSALGLSVSNAGEIPAGHQKMFTKLDTDSDGGISKEEADAGEYKFLSKKFEAIDADSNGSINIEEFSAEIASRNAAKKEAGGE